MEEGDKDDEDKEPAQVTREYQETIWQAKYSQQTRKNAYLTARKMEIKFLIYDLMTSKSEESN